jgi:hypothetical protein
MSAVRITEKRAGAPMARKPTRIERIPPKSSQPLPGVEGVFVVVMIFYSP